MKDDYKFINRYPKEELYAIYIEAVPNFVAYEKITRTKMIKSVYEHITYNPECLEYYVCQEDLAFLVQLVTNNEDFKKLNETDILKLEVLTNKFLVYYDVVDRKYKIPQLIKDAIHLYMPTGNHSYIDEFYHFIHGLIQTRGIMPLEEAKTIYNKLKPKHLVLDFSNTYYSMSRFLVLTDKTALELYGFIALKDYGYIYDNYEYEPKFKYTWDMYQSISKHGLDLNQKVLSEFYHLMLKKNTKQQLKSMLEMSMLASGAGHTFMDNLFISNLNEITGNLDYSNKLYQSVRSSLPNWIFKGDPLNIVSEEEVNKIMSMPDIEEDAHLDDIEPCFCGSGKTLNACCLDIESDINEKVILPVRKAKLFYKLLHYLMYVYKNQKIAKTDVVVIKFIEKLRHDEFMHIKDKVLSNPAFIDEFISMNVANLTQEQLEILEGFKNSMKGEFVAVKYVNKKLMIYDQKMKKVYLLTGIIDPIALLINHEDLPTVIETRLIPLEDYITYDIHIMRTQIHMGPNIKKMIEDEIKDMVPISSNKGFVKR